MLTFLFWNIKNQPLQQTIARLVRAHQVDVLMLAECQDNILIGDILSKLNYNRQKPYERLFSDKCSRIQFIARFSERLIPAVHGTKYALFRQLALPGYPEILLVVTHLPRKLYRSDTYQVANSTLFAQQIQQVEAEVGHRRTLLVGDLNMSPFEQGVTNILTLNATMSQREARNGQRQSDGEKYPYFYNPMWNLFGDVTPGPLGTYHYRTEANAWHMFDQVLVRPALLNLFNTNHVRILETDGQESFLSATGLPDHLPILFALDL